MEVYLKAQSNIRTCKGVVRGLMVIYPNTTFLNSLIVDLFHNWIRLENDGVFWLVDRDTQNALCQTLTIINSRLLSLVIYLQIALVVDILWAHRHFPRHKFFEILVHALLMSRLNTTLCHLSLRFSWAIAFDTRFGWHLQRFLSDLKSNIRLDRIVISIWMGIN
jgi:hypothetical protein